MRARLFGHPFRVLVSLVPAVFLALAGPGQSATLPLELGAPSLRAVEEGRSLSFNVGVQAVSGTSVTLRLAEGPPGGVFQDHGDGTGTFAWTPDFQQAGEHHARFEAVSDGAVGSAATTIDVSNVNRRPEASAGGSYSTYAGLALSLDGGASVDPDGDALAYQWDFGDGTEGTGAVPVHTYAGRGTYRATLTVSDGSLGSSSSATVEVLDILRGRAFTSGGNKAIKLSGGKPEWCLELEPVGGSFDIEDVDMATLAMRSTGTGSVDGIAAIGGKTSAGSDRDGNTVQDIRACFRSDDLRHLFSKVHGTVTLKVTIQGRLTNGAPIQAPMTVVVQARGRGRSAFAYPNPMNPSGMIAWRTTVGGPVRVDVYDPAGRLVRRLVDESWLPEGSHEVLFDGRDTAGRELATGVYFYRIRSEEGAERGRLMILR